MKAGVVATDAVDGDLTSGISISGQPDLSKVGSYEITYRVSDTANLETVVKRKVNVTDQSKPVLSGVHDITVAHGSQQVLDLTAGVTATDAVDGDLSSNIAITGQPDLNKVGVYEVTYRVSDGVGLEAVGNRRITVVDQASPLINLLGDATISLEQGDSFVDPGAQASDAVDGDLTGSIVVTGAANVDTTKVGSYDLIYTVSDSASLTASVTRTVTVVAPSNYALTLISPHGNSTPATSQSFSTGTTVTAQIDSKKVVNSVGTYELIGWQLSGVNDAAGNASGSSTQVTFTMSADVTLEWQWRFADVDTDNDGVWDRKDAFPLDNAASVDADFDGKPDEWNASADPSNSTLTLDDAVTISPNIADVMAERAKLEAKLVSGQTHADFSLASLMTKLDLDYPGLEAVKAASAKNDLDTAGKELLAYFRKRFPLQSSLDLGPVKLGAQKTMVHEFSGSTPDQYQYRGSSIDWVTDGHSELTWMNFFLSISFNEEITDAYRKTRNTEFFRGWRSQMLSFYEHNYPFGNGATNKHKAVEDPYIAALRIRRLGLGGRVNDYLHDPEFNVETLAYFLNALHYEVELILSDDFKSVANHLITELKNIFRGAIEYPELKRGNEPNTGWAAIALAKAKEEIFKMTLPDGMNEELSPNYHQDYRYGFAYFVDTGAPTGLVFDPAYLQRLRKLYDAMYGFGLPVLGTSGLRKTISGDGWPNSEMLTRYWLRYKDVSPAHKYFETKGQEGTPPHRNTILDHSGFYGLRSDWGYANDDKGIGLIITNGIPKYKERGHSEPDNMTFEMTAYGRTLMSDASQLTYGGSTEANENRARFRQSRVHRTVTLDEMDIAAGGNSIRWLVDQTEGNTKYDLVELENPNYADLKHNRTIIMVDKQHYIVVDRLSGAASSGKLRAHFQLSNEGEGKASVTAGTGDLTAAHYHFDPANLSAVTRFPTGGNVLVKGAAIAGVSMVDETLGKGHGAKGAGFEAAGIGVEVERPAWAYEVDRAAQEQVFVTAMVLFEGDNTAGKIEPNVSVTHSASDGKVTLTVDAASYSVTLPNGAAGLTDTDDDGEPNITDAFPYDPAEKLDTDKDGIGNVADLDDDGDGFSDAYEIANNLDPLDPSDGLADPDKDSLTTAEEIARNTDPNKWELHELLRDGDFESRTLTLGEVNYWHVKLGTWKDHSIDGSKLWHGSHYGTAAAHGDYTLELDNKGGSQLDFISQELHTVADAKYKFKLDYKIQGSRFQSRGYELFWGDKLIDTFDPPDSAYDWVWKQKNYLLTGDGTPMTLMLREIADQNDYNGILLDNLSVKMVEPGADITAPLLLVDAQAQTKFLVGSTYVAPHASAYDSVDGSLTASITKSETLDLSKPGDYVVTYAVKDKSLNETSVDHKVTVVAADTQAPTLTLIGAETIVLKTGDTFSDPGAHAVDDIDGQISTNILTTGSVDTTTVGSYTLTYRVKDLAMNESVKTRLVQVVDSCFGGFNHSETKYGKEWKASPYYHLCRELDAAKPKFTPSMTTDNSVQRLTNKRIFDNARDLHNYNPRFLPGRIYFDADNLPWIYVNNMNQLDLSDPNEPKHKDPTTNVATDKALHEITNDYESYRKLYDVSNPCTGCDAYILRLTSEGKWVYVSIQDMAKAFGFRMNDYGVVGSRYAYVAQVYFRDNGDVFFKADHGVFHYIASENKWAGYKANWLGNYYMVGDGVSLPVFVLDRPSATDAKHNLYKLNIDGLGSGTLEYVPIDHGFRFGLERGSQAAILYDNTLHLAGMSYDTKAADSNADYNTANYYIRYHLETGQLDTQFMGWTGSTTDLTVDPHNQPALVMDSDGYLHYLSGAHNHRIWHRKSLLPISDSAWNNNNQSWAQGTTADDKFSKGQDQPTARFPNDSEVQSGVEYVGRLSGGYTYVHPRIDSQNIIHLLMRNSAPDGGTNGYRLEYIRGIPKGQGDYLWQDRGTLVQPNWSNYTHYYQKIHQDKHDNIYTTFGHSIQNFRDESWFNNEVRRIYTSEADCLSSAPAGSVCINVKNEHYKNWPNEPLSGPTSRYVQLYNHDPMLLGTTDFGQTWTLTTTHELLQRSQKNELAALAAGESSAPGKVKSYGFAKGGTKPYRFVWTVDGNVAGIGSSPEFSNLITGTHTIRLMVTDANDVSASSNFVIDVK